MTPVRRALKNNEAAVSPSDGPETDAKGIDLFGQVTSDSRRSTTFSKELGAYYTDEAIADFLVRWAVRSSQDVVLDPSFGEGVFLTTAARRLRELGGDPDQQIYGVEIDAITHRRFMSRYTNDRPSSSILHADFFELVPGALPSADAVVGNPPFIRYQRFSGGLRERALSRARESGVEISQLASSWAPFLVHAVQFVKPAGRLAMVAPAELAHAGYARPVMDYLCRNFRTVVVVTFASKLFSHLSEDTVLLLAVGRGEPFESLKLVDLPGLPALLSLRSPDTDLPSGIEVDSLALSEENERLLHYLLPARIRALYQELRRTTGVVALERLARVGIGYVTGDNDFFHVNRATALAYDLPPHFLRPAVRDGSELAGLRFTQDDWQAFHASGRSNLLLYVSGSHPLPDSLQSYLFQGIRKGVPERYKCRTRRPWYSVPHVYSADGFLTYMSGANSKLVADEAGAVAPNTLHLVRLHPGCNHTAVELAAGWQTSLTAFSCEYEGHSLGGGMLKLEPTEARRVVIALPDLAGGDFDALVEQLDRMLRRDHVDAARSLADDALLRRGLGLSDSDIRLLREGYAALRNRRTNR